MSDDNVIKLNITTTLDLSCPEMLRNIADENPKHAFLIVWPEDGSEPTYSSSMADTPLVVYHIQEFLHKLYANNFGDEND